ncbi:MAG: hypothetical protein J5J06_03280 [Phycisphaerae bacterium]|nr:hypothetical protein [Phycisphaerae bacterium]
MKTRILTAAITSFFLISGGLRAAPQADLISPSWQLDFTFADPQRITVTLPGQDEPVTYWYMLFKVTNNTGQDVDFFPSFDLVTDTLDVVHGGENVPPGVYEMIAARHRKEYPFFAPPYEITGKLLQGAENARSSAAVFRDFDPEANAFTIYVAGLSGEIARVNAPAVASASKSDMADKGPHVLRRTLALAYDLPGDVRTREQTRAVRRTRDWVMR